MFAENLRILRKQKGLSQEELAERLHVVRQTVSKWEKGLSVPDADLLIRIAEVLETSVSTLLGDRVEDSGDNNDKRIVAHKLEQLNALLAEKNRRSRRIWRTTGIVLASIAALFGLWLVLSLSVSQHDGETSAFITEQAKMKEPASVNTESHR